MLLLRLVEITHRCRTLMGLVDVAVARASALASSLGRLGIALAVATVSAG